MTPNTRFFIRGINEVIEDSSQQTLPITFAKVTEVDSKGSVISAVLFLQNIGLTPYRGIPVIKNKYMSAPIRVGDTVLLITISHLLENLLETKTISEPIFINSYVAIPFAFTSDLASITNNFHLKNPEGTITGKIDKSQAALRGSSCNLNVEFNNISLTGQQITIGNNRDTLRTLLLELIDALLASNTEIGGGGDMPHVHKTIDSGTGVELNNLKNKISAVFR